VVDREVIYANLVFADSVLENMQIKVKSQVFERHLGNKFMNYPVGDFLIQIKNAALAHKKSLQIRKTRLVEAVATTLQKEGFVRDVKNVEGQLEMSLVYKHKEPVIMNLHLISRPGLRVYANVDELGKRRGPTLLILSTSKGVMSSKEAIKERVGGEVIAEIL
jgi:small subunit ribosomal protein S8